MLYPKPARPQRCRGAGCGVRRSRCVRPSSSGSASTRFTFHELQQFNFREADPCFQACPSGLPEQILTEHGLTQSVQTLDRQAQATTLRHLASAERTSLTRRQLTSAETLRSVASRTTQRHPQNGTPTRHRPFGWQAGGPPTLRFRVFPRRPGMNTRTRWGLGVAAIVLLWASCFSCSEPRNRIRRSNQPRRQALPCRDNRNWPRGQHWHSHGGPIRGGLGRRFVTQSGDAGVCFSELR